MRTIAIVTVVTASLFWLPAIFLGADGIDWISSAIYAGFLLFAIICWLAGRKKG